MVLLQVARCDISSCFDEKHYRFCVIVLCSLLLVWWVNTPAFGAYRVGVLYPETVEPYRSVFRSIVDGVIQNLGLSSAVQRAVSTKDVPGLRQWLQDQAVDSVITLGRDATLTYERTAVGLPQVIGALNVSPQTRPDATGVSLAVEPSRVFNTLKLIAPKKTRVWVVYSPNRDRWIIDLAQDTAATHQLTLMALAAKDSQASASHFADILKNADPATDALWLLINSELVDSQVVLPEIVVRSWRRRLLVFSNSLSHADLGVVFAVFADNEALGRRLADLALERAKNPEINQGIEPLRDIKRAINLRAAAQAGLVIDPAIQRQFDLVYPLLP